LDPGKIVIQPTNVKESNRKKILTLDFGPQELVGIRPVKHKGFDGLGIGKEMIEKKKKKMGVAPKRGFPSKNGGRKIKSLKQKEKPA